MKLHYKYICTTALGLFFASFALADGSADSDSDALSLQSAVAEPLAAAELTSKLFFELAVGNSAQRYILGSQHIRRATLDISLNAKLNNQTRLVFSDRIDFLYPKLGASESTVNSFREGFITWQSENRDTIVEAGRIALRNGVAYGYNPIDFFRDGSLRALTSANPFALRDNRLGTVMLRGQRLWQGGSMAVSYSPKVSDLPGRDGWSLDLGSTNNRNRLLLNLNNQVSETLNTQVLLYKDGGEPFAFGASLTALVSEASTMHVEWTRSRERSLLAKSLALPSLTSSENRLAAGLTYTTLGKTSITAEYQFNGFALSKRDWRDLSISAPISQVAYLIESQRRQELASRSALLLYVSKKDLLFNDLDLTGFVKINLSDNSRLYWIELRRNWAKFDLALQLQRHIGRSGSEFGILPDTRVLQVLGTYYF